MLELQKIVGDFLTDRPVMQENNKPEQLFKLLRDEVDEAEVEINDPEAMATELADVLFLTMTLANQYGIDLERATREKTARNHLKYPAEVFSNGRTYSEARKFALDNWRALKGEATFYETPDDQPSTQP